MAFCYSIREHHHRTYAPIAKSWIRLTKDEDTCLNVECRRNGWTWEDDTPATYLDWYGSDPGSGELCAIILKDGCMEEGVLEARDHSYVKKVRQYTLFLFILSG